MKKNFKFLLIAIVMVAMVLGYYFYLSNRNNTEGKQEATVAVQGNAQAAAIITKDLKDNYPQSPREVLKLYARITQLYYAQDTTTEQVEKLGMQARILFDDELKKNQSDEEFINALKADVANYHSIGRYIGDYKVDNSNSFVYKNIGGKNYAIGTVLFYVREGKELSNVFQSYKLRKDADGRWKILYWELTGAKDIKGE